MNRETIVRKIKPLADEFMQPLTILNQPTLASMRAALISLCVMCFGQGQLYELNRRAAEIQAKIDAEKE